MPLPPVYRQVQGQNLSTTAARRTGSFPIHATLKPIDTIPPSLIGTLGQVKDRINVMGSADDRVRCTTVMMMRKGLLGFGTEESMANFWNVQVSV